MVKTVIIISMLLALTIAMASIDTDDRLETGHYSACSGIHSTDFRHVPSQTTPVSPPATSTPPHQRPTSTPAPATTSTPGPPLLTPTPTPPITRTPGPSLLTATPTPPITRTPGPPLATSTPAPPTGTPAPTSTPVPMTFVTIEPGTYLRGSPDSEPCREYLGTNETQHVVVLTRGFYMMTTETTRHMWSALKELQPDLPLDPSYPGAGPTLNHPVQQCTWFETILFANLLSLEHHYTRCYYADPGFTIPIDAQNYVSGPHYCDFDADGYRLPTEAEWEYAARAGTTGPFSFDEPFFDESTCNECESELLPVMEEYAVFCANNYHCSEVVGSKLTNPWGLYDMHGNVFEWCWDRSAPYPEGLVVDPTGPDSGTVRAKRGGRWLNPAWFARSARRCGNEPCSRGIALGFRLVRTAHSRSVP